MACNLREPSREKFKNLGLDYSKINEEDIYKLMKLLKIELARYLIEGGEHALQMDMTVSPILKKNIKVLKTKGLQYAEIQIDGSYFKRREGITFSSTGFIGFGNEFSDCNVKPILDAFNKWCDEKAS